MKIIIILFNKVNYYPLSQSSKLQKIIILLLYKAKYIAYKETFKDNFYIKALISQLLEKFKALIAINYNIYTNL